MKWPLPTLDSVGALVSQAQIRKALFFMASSIHDFANTIIAGTSLILLTLTSCWRKEAERE